MPTAHTYTGPTSDGATTSPCNEARLNKDSMSNANQVLNPVNLLPYPCPSNQIPVSDNTFGNGQPRFTYTRQQPTIVMLLEKPFYSEKLRRYNNADCK